MTEKLKKKRFTSKELKELKKEGEELYEEMAKADQADGDAIMNTWDKLWTQEEMGCPKVLPPKVKKNKAK
ncbi:MAG: hypothetical protein PHD51_01810 [Patescibacteria group bacterium]|nr:hypothetical protein [Patescibacteria group bacterium]MDD5490401.1 hypothetical protein [Patescibacteria group bacterium]